MKKVRLRREGRTFNDHPEKGGESAWKEEGEFTAQPEGGG